MDVAAELLIHIERNAVTDIRPAIDLFYEDYLISKIFEIQTNYHFVDVPTILNTNNATLRCKFTDSTAYASDKLPKKSAAISVKYDSATCRDFKIPAYTKKKTRTIIVFTKSIKIYTIGKNSSGNRDVSGNGMTSEIQ